MNLLQRLGIEQGLLENAFDILDSDEDDALEAKEFISMIFKLLHPPESQDVLIIHRKLDRLSDAMGCPKGRNKDQADTADKVPRRLTRDEEKAQAVDAVGD